MGRTQSQYVLFVLFLQKVSSQVEFIRNHDSDTKTLQIIDRSDNSLMRTQFLPTRLGEEEASVNTLCDGPEKEAKFRNSTYEMKNGKLYKVTRVRKKTSVSPCLERINTRAADRRHSYTHQNQGQPEENARPISYFQKLFPSLLSPPIPSEKPKRQIANAILSVVPHLSSGAYGETENHTEPSWKVWANTNPIASKAIARKKEKLQKLLNLFTIVQFDNDGCSADGLEGVCYHQSECAERNGIPMGPCAQGYAVCCYLQRSCGQTTSENSTYFVNEGFPAIINGGPSVCAFTIMKSHPLVRQIRLDFETFELQGPVNGTCMMDRFMVTGQNRNSIIPDMCGANSGQHMYVDVDASSGPYTLNVVTMGQGGRKWRVKVTQLMPTSELLAPQNCLQYFTDYSGVIESFNFQQSIPGNAGEAGPGYFNNLNYDACIKKGEAFCSVTYSTQEDTEQVEAPFQLINMNSEGETLIPRGQAGAEVFNCPDDYIVINGIRLCGDRLNDATVELDYTRSAPVTDMSAGPAQMTVRTDEQHVSRGFRLYYRQNPCLDAI